MLELYTVGINLEQGFREGLPTLKHLEFKKHPPQIKLGSKLPTHPKLW